jgi:Transposase DDE domain group 1
MLRPGNAGSNTASEHIEVTRLALALLTRRLRRLLLRTDSGGGTQDFLTWLTSPGRRLHYSIGMTITEDMHQAILTLPDRVWEAAYDAGGKVRRGAWDAELTGLLDPTGWPARMRVIVRKERPHPGAQLRFTDIEGRRVTAFATDAPAGQLADLELRHRRQAGCEDRIRCAKDTGLRGLPLHGFAQNQGLMRVGGHGLRTDRLDGDARPGRPRPGLGTQTPAAAPVHRRRTAGPRRRRLQLHLASTWPWATQITTAITRMQTLAPG